MGLLTPLYGVRGNFDVTTTGDAPFCIKALSTEPITGRIGGASSLLQKLSGGVLGQRKKRSRDLATTEASLFSWFFGDAPKKSPKILDDSPLAE